MTIEEKAKSYDEVLERVKPLYEWAKKDDSPMWSTYEYLFPQLAESEDERIRRALIDGVRQIRCKNGVTQEQMLAYLEKQKEPENISASTMIPSCWNTDSLEEEVERYFYYEFEDGMTNEDIAYHFANWQRQKDLEENSKSSDSIPPDCVSNAKGEDRWHKVEDSLPDNTREVLCKDAIGNYFIGRYYSKGIWEISIYDDCDKSNEDNPPVVMWIDIPSEKQKEPHYTKRNALFDKCVENCDPEVMKKVSDEIDKMLQKEQKPYYCHYGGDPSIERCKYCSVTCSARLMEEQKPADWSEEDEKDIAHIIRVLDDCYAYGKHDLSKTDHENLVGTLKSIHPQLKSEWSEDDEGELQNAIDALEFLGKKGVYKSESGYDAALQAASWLKNLSLDLKKRNEDVTKLCSNEWSEEDEEIFNNIIEKAKGGHWIEVNEITWLIAWFKSLRLQPKQE